MAYLQGVIGWLFVFVVVLPIAVRCAIWGRRMAWDVLGIVFNLMFLRRGVVIGFWVAVASEGKRAHLAGAVESVR